MYKDIFHADNLNLDGKSIVRKAVRGVIYSNSKILLIHSLVNKDYKFPGGGVKSEETDEEALRREISEECGLIMNTKENIIGVITEYSTAKENEIDYFMMESHYYKCSIESFNFKELNLDSYEADLQFNPKWVTLSEAIRVNKKILRTGINIPKWTKRETMFLEYLSQNIELLKLSC